MGGMSKVRLKWVENKNLDHVIDTETDLKAACILKDAIKRSSTGFLTAKSVADRQHPLGLPVPVLRFLRRLVNWPDEFPVSALQKQNESDGGLPVRILVIESSKEFSPSCRFFMSFPRGYGAQKKVKAWMNKIQKLPYISPYDDSSNIDPESDLMEKRAVGVLHELLSLTIHKKTNRNYFIEVL